MPVKVKFDAYPFQDYGIIGGKITKKYTNGDREG
jgi:HlyD family secretion protein